MNLAGDEVNKYELALTKSRKAAKLVEAQQRQICQVWAPWAPAHPQPSLLGPIVRGPLPAPALCASDSLPTI